jgi:hypothetical protein
MVGMYEIVCHQQPFEILIYWGQRAREARKRGEAVVRLMVGRPDDGEDFERGLLHIMTACYERSIRRVNSLDIQLRDRWWGFGVESP